MHTHPTAGRRALAVLLAALTVLACSVFPGAGATAPSATEPLLTPTPPAANTALATPPPSRTPAVFLTNTVVPRVSPTPGEFVTEAFGLSRAETLVLLGQPPSAASLDPAVTTGGADGYVGHLYSGLVRLSPALQVEADLAESWTVSPDGSVYTFTLRAGLAFSSGTPITAADVAYSWERAADPATGSTTVLTYLGDIAGLPAKVAGTAGTITGLAVADERTLVVTLEQPRSQFLAKLTYPVAFVVDQANVAQGSTWMAQPNASGPFMLRNLDVDRALIFERNPGYHTPAGVAYVAYLFVPLDMAGLLYEAGEIDIGLVDPQLAARARDDADPLHAEWLSTTTLCTVMFRLDTNLPPLDDPLVRLALVQALDRVALRDGLAGPEQVLGDTVLPPGLPGYSADRPRFAFDVEQARASLAASRYAGTMPPLLLADAGTAAAPSALGAAMAQMWRDNLGLRVTIVPLASGQRPPAGESLGHVLVYSWCADYPDPENFLEVLFHSSSSFNISAYANPQVDAWLAEARADPDPAHRFDLFRQVETQILNDVAVIPWLYPSNERLIKPYVKGYVLAPMSAPVIHLVRLERTAP
jgi:oligopeptide transport system substrate-binding protein